MVKLPPDAVEAASPDLRVMHLPAPPALLTDVPDVVKTLPPAAPIPVLGPTPSKGEPAAAFVAVPTLISILPDVPEMLAPEDILIDPEDPSVLAPEPR